MPDTRLSKTRETLPFGYQFGDAREPELDLEGAKIEIDGKMHILKRVVLDAENPSGV